MESLLGRYVAYFEASAGAKVTTEIFVTSAEARLYFLPMLFRGGILYTYTRTVLWRCQSECGISYLPEIPEEGRVTLQCRESETRIG